jgi:type IX secretion system PorP/SprF family membrane protein
MMKPYQTLLVIVLLSLAAQPARAQDPQFTQFYHAPLYLNPAFTGTTEQYRVAGNYRYQWTALGANFHSTTVGFDYNAAPVRSGFGLLLHHDRAGQLGLNTTGVNGLYSFLVPLSRAWQLRLGVQAGLANRRLDFSELVFPSQVRPGEPNVWEGPAGSSRWYTSFGAGLAVYNANFWLGAAVHHLNQPDVAMLPGEVSGLPLKVSAHVGGNLEVSTLNGAIYLLPSMLYKQQGAARQLDAGLRVAFERAPLVLGAFYRGLPFLQSFDQVNQDALAATVGLRWGALSFGYSYDLTISGLQRYSGGSHELALVYQWGSLRTRRLRGVACPLYERPLRGSPNWQ